MDYTCWMEVGCMIGANCRSQWGLLEASLLSWWPRLATLDLVWTMQPFVKERQTTKHEINLPHRQRQLMMHKKSVG